MIIPRIKQYNRLNSTNSYGIEHFEELDTGDIIISEIQTRGRGRFNRIWEGSSSKNIYMSIIIKPEGREEIPYTNLTQYLSVIINRILIRDYEIKTNIKWPNDILYEGKKIAGILAEGKMSQNKIEGVVLGVGINVNYDVTETGIINATSIGAILGREIDKQEIIQKVTEEFFKGYEEFKRRGFKEISEEYKQMCRFTDKKIKITSSCEDGEYELISINEDGTISVRDKSNRIIKVINGDIQC